MRYLYITLGATRPVMGCMRENWIFRSERKAPVARMSPEESKWVAEMTKKLYVRNSPDSCSINCPRVPSTPPFWKVSWLQPLSKSWFLRQLSCLPRPHKHEMKGNRLICFVMSQLARSFVCRHRCWWCSTWNALGLIRWKPCPSSQAKAGSILFCRTCFVL